jgi:hypothetical protein
MGRITRSKSSLRSRPSKMYSSATSVGATVSSLESKLDGGDSVGNDNLFIKRQGLQKFGNYQINEQYEEPDRRKSSEVTIIVNKAVHSRRIKCPRYVFNNQREQKKTIVSIVVNKVSGEKRIISPSYVFNDQGKQKNYIRVTVKVDKVEDKNIIICPRYVLNSKTEEKKNHALAVKRHRVLVIGAGIAGLACARELKERNFDVVVIEARNRPGGRLKTVPLRLAHDGCSTDNTKGISTFSNNIPRSNGISVLETHFPLSQHCTIAQATDSLHREDKCPPPFCPVDVGGAFIHGVKHNPIQEICNRIGISTSQPMSRGGDVSASNESGDCLLVEYHNSGWPVSVEVDFKVQKRFNYVLEQSFLLCMEILVHSVGPNDFKTASNADHSREPKRDFDHRIKPDFPIPKGADRNSSFGLIFDYVASKGELVSMQSECLERNSGGYTPNSIEASLFGWHVMNLEMSCGTTLSNLGLTWNDDEAYGFGGAHVLLKEGFSSLVEGLTEGLDIQYGVEVTGVRIVQEEEHKLERRKSKRTTKAKHSKMGKYAEAKEMLHSDSSESDLLMDGKTIPYPVQVRTKSGKTLEADAIVCTLPLGIMEIPPGDQGHVEFIPPLPSRKREAIARLGFGHYNKCALSFPQAFWNSAADFIGVVGSPICGTNVLFCNVSIIHNLPVIVVIYGGQYAKEVEQLTDDVVVRECMELLRRICGKRSIPSPIDYTMTRWGKDRWARGSFSYCPVGIDGTKELQKMSEPIYESSFSTFPKSYHPLIMFAGEATSPYHPSTIHGAYLSGIREAYRLDFALYPKENKNLKFKDSFIFRRTFGGLRRRFVKKKTTLQVGPKELTGKGSSHGASGDRRSRRNTRKLIKRKHDSLNGEIRRSRRQKVTVFDYEKENLSDPAVEGQDGLASFSLAEDLAIVRGADVYGDDADGMKAIKSQMFPLPDGMDTGRKQNTKHLKMRYKQLVSKNATLATRNIDLSRWLTPHADTWWSLREYEKTQGEDRSHMKIPIRRSLRKFMPKKKFSNE